MAGKGIGGVFWLAVVAAAGVAIRAGAQVTLNDWGSDAGLVATHQPDEVGIPLAQDWQTGGLAVGDFNNDGCQDVFWIGGGGTADKLFINNCDGSGTFTNQATAWGLTALHCGNGSSATMGNAKTWSAGTSPHGAASVAKRLRYASACAWNIWVLPCSV